MAKLYITEYGNITEFNSGSSASVNGWRDILHEPAVADQVLDLSSETAQVSAMLSNSTQFVRLQADCNCSVLFAANPTATTSNRRLVKDVSEIVNVASSSGLKVSAILNA
jgi:hypothetical protein